jgi:hypothetical protein
MVLIGITEHYTERFSLSAYEEQNPNSISYEGDGVRDVTQW